MHEHDESPSGQLVGWGATRIPAGPQGGRPGMRFVTEIDQLLTADRPHTTVAVHPQGSR